MCFRARYIHGTFRIPTLGRHRPDGRAAAIEQREKGVAVKRVGHHTTSTDNRHRIWAGGLYNRQFLSRLILTQRYMDVQSTNPECIDRRRSHTLCRTLPWAHRRE